MPTPLWSDIFKTFTYAFSSDPLSRKLQSKEIVGAGIISPDSIPSISPDGSYWNGQDNRLIRLRETQDFVDLSTVSNRISRYKEYERLRAVPEVETCLTIFSDEACVAGNTKVATPFGFKTIKTLTEENANDKFLVYCYDFKKKDYTLGWAHHPRKTKTSETVELIFDNGGKIECTPDHKLLLRTGEWIQAENIKVGDNLMPFYREKPNLEYNKLLSGQFPRIFTFNNGWVTERQLVDEWRTSKPIDKYQIINIYTRLINQGMSMDKILAMVEETWVTVKARLRKAGFTYKELKYLSKNKSDSRKVIGKFKGINQDVYDLTVEEHHNFATDHTIVHNCQKDEYGNVLKIEAENDDVRKEVEFLLMSRQMLNFNKRIWADFKSLLIYGDLFYELVTDLDSPNEGILKIQRLPPESIYRIETTKGKVIEFQQSKEGPDYQSLVRAPVTVASDQEIQMATAIRFAPEQIVHMRINEDRRQFYPYGSSIIEPARGPAYQLRLMEDSMLTYRLARAPERRVFYIDVGQLPGFKAEAFIERMKDQFRKRKISLNQNGFSGSSSVEERYQPPAVEEDYWIPTRPNSNTRIDTLPGAQNLGEIDDAIYFRLKLMTALNFPKNYLNVDDPAQSKITLSSQDVKFARTVERYQASLEDGIYEIAQRHLHMRGFPPETYDDLKISMTPPSEWRELSRAEIVNNRIQNVTSLKSAGLISDYDLMRFWMHYSEEETKDMLARSKLQKLEEARLQVLQQNPQLLGVGIPAGDEEQVGATDKGPNSQLEVPAEPPPPELSPEGSPAGAAPPEMGAPAPPSAPMSGGPPLPEPNEEDILKYDLQIQDYASEEDNESQDYSIE
jgi:hypothetical protein